MSDYQDVVRKEAKAFYDAHHAEFEADQGESGGKSPIPSFTKWIDRTEKLAARVSEISAKWGSKEYHWVQTNTRNKNPHGDLKDNSFGSFLQDIRQEIKKLAKK